MANHVVIVEDEKEIGEVIVEHLQEKGYRTTWIKSGEDLINYLKDCDLILLDVMLPGLDGFTIGSRIKSHHPNLPIILLTARSAIEDKLNGLEFADDYMTKPFHPDELTARMEICLRRYDKKQESIVHIGHLQINLEGFEVINLETDETIPLTETQFKLLFTMVKHANQILTKERLYELIWDQTYVEGDKTLSVHIRYLRKKIEKDPNHPIIIETIRGIGYRVKQ
ncbi:response regulator transcription factor [Bacillus gobiensis]|uniref:response regulator transcription factor n=1 Tax=Bacillus gobiensis TaxID=1441095 RepID=UPI003D20719D